jgi:hypothetical protein
MAKSQVLAEQPAGGWRGISYAARRLELSAQRVRDLVDTGRLPAIRTASGQRLLTDADIERERRARRAAERPKRRARTRGEP